MPKSAVGYSSSYLELQPYTDFQPDALHFASTYPGFWHSNASLSAISRLLVQMGAGGRFRNLELKSRLQMAGAPNDENQQPQQPMAYVRDIEPEPKVCVVQ